MARWLRLRSVREHAARTEPARRDEPERTYWQMIDDLAEITRERPRDVSGRGRSDE